MTATYGWIAALALASFMATAWLTARARAYALARDMIDVAGPRASHSAPTPRGGGVSIVAVGLVVIIVACVGFGASVDVPVALAGGGAAVALVGWLDDHGHIAAPVRFAVHLAAAAWAVGWLGAFPAQAMFGIGQPLWWIDAVLSVLLIGWSINLFNFMDGIDGIAASQATTVFAGAWVLVMATVGSVAWLDAMLLGLAAATLAFVALWNWPTAKIFMGDACSGFLGFLIGALAVGLAQISPGLGVAVLVLYGVFLVDATVTVVTRLLRGKNPAVAHRSHGYQILSRRAGRHLPVTLGSIALGAAWLFPWSYAIAVDGMGSVEGAMVALMPLVVLAIVVGSGRDDT